MLMSVSWSQYLIAVFIALGVYYVLIGIVYSRNEFSSFKFRKSKQEIYLPQLFSSYRKHPPKAEVPDDTFEKVEELASRLKEAIGKAASKNLSKEDFIISLQSFLKNYHFLKGSPFLVAINNLIASECDKHNFIQLNADERVMLWN
jgi:hypothetical protein